MSIAPGFGDDLGPGKLVYVREPSIASNRDSPHLPRQYGNLILSRLPVLQVFNHLLPHPAEGGIKHMPPLVDAWKHARPGEPHPPSTGLFNRRQWPMGGHCRDYFALTPNVASRVASIDMDAATDASDHQPLRLVLRD